jgi:hypothetical protein
VPIFWISCCKRSISARQSLVTNFRYPCRGIRDSVRSRTRSVKCLTAVCFCSLTRSRSTLSIAGILAPTLAPKRAGAPALEWYFTPSRTLSSRRADQGDEFALPDRKADVPKRRAAVRGESLFEAIDQKGISHRRSSSLRFWWEKQSLQVSQSLCRCDLLS